MRGLTIAILLAATTAVAEPPPPGVGGYGIYNPAGPYNLANKCLYFDQANDSDTKLCRTGANEVTLTVGNVGDLVCDASYCTFASGPKIGASIPFADATGTLTLQNVDALDSTTETTIEGAIDTLANLTSIQAQAVTLAGELHVEAATHLNQDLTTDSTVAALAVLTLGNSGLHVLDTDASHDLIITPGSNLSADRILTITTGDAARALSIEADSTINQDLSSDATPTFAGASFGDANLTNVGDIACDSLSADGTAINVSSPLTFGSSMALKTGTIADGDAHPDISAANIFVTSANTGATAITDLDLPTVGKAVALCGGSNTNSSTIADAGNFAINGAMTLGLDQCIWLYVQADNDYVELGRNNQAFVLTPWTSTIDADDNDLGDGGTFEVDGFMCTTDNTLTMPMSTDTVTIKDTSDNATGVILTLDHDNPNADNDDVINTINFKGNDGTDADNTYCRITTEIDNETNTIERGTMRFLCDAPGAPTEFMRLDGSSGSGSVVVTPPATLTGGFTLGADGSTTGYDIVTAVAAATDADPDNATHKCGQDAYWNATATNVTGGMCVGGSSGIGSRKVQCTSFGATADGDTLAILVQKDGVYATTTLTAKNGGAAGAQWNCETSTAVCCTNLYNYLVANPVTDITSVSNATASYVGFVPAADTGDIFLTITEAGGGGAPVFGSATNSLNGTVVFGGVVAFESVAGPLVRLRRPNDLTSDISIYTGGLTSSGGISAPSVISSSSFIQAATIFRTGNQVFNHGMFGATPTAIIGNVGTKQTLYTVPAGKTARITEIDCRTTGTALVAMHASFGGDPGATDYLTDTDMHSIFTGTTTTAGWTRANGVAHVTYAAATIIGAMVNTTEADARTLTCAVYGVLF